MKTIYTLVAALLIIGLYFGGRHLYFKPEYNRGEVVPAFNATLLNGEPFAMSDLRGKYVLIDFWGSWCGPCRYENPQLVDLYNTYHREGFEILSIGLESSKERWRQAIRSDGLRWKYHIGEFDRFDSVLAEEFGVRRLPTKFLVDPDGYIIGVNMEVASIDDLLKEKLM